MSAKVSAKLSLGPLLFNWPADDWRDFYFRMADEAPVDTVHVGEVVCAKRAPFFQPHLAEVCARLEAAGKEVVHSTLALIMTEAEMAEVRAAAAATATAAAENILIEANDAGTAGLLAGNPHVIGPFVNVYNEGTLAYFAHRGAIRVSLPGELPAASLAALAETAACIPDPVELEVQAFGRLPLALSARCYHARARNLHKDGCQFVCADDRDGLVVRTLDDEPFLAINGTQTLSYRYCNLLGELGKLQAMGIRRFRLSPHDTDMVAVANIYREVIDGALEPGAASERLGVLTGGVPFSNGFFHGTEGVAFDGP